MERENTRQDQGAFVGGRNSGTVRQSNSVGMLGNGDVGDEFKVVGGDVVMRAGCVQLELVWWCHGRRGWRHGNHQFWCHFGGMR